MPDFQDAESQANSAKLRYRLGDWHGALRAIDRALADHPDRPGWWFGRGLVLEAMGRHGEAAECFERVTVLSPEHAAAWARFGVMLNQTGSYGRALDAFEQCQRLDPDGHASYCGRIASYGRLGQHDSAELMFYLAQQHGPDCPDCFDQLACSLADRGDARRAVWCWRRALGLEPGHPQAGANLGRYLASLARAEEARRYLEAHLQHFPDDGAVKLDLASVLVGMGRLEASRRLVVELTSARPDDAAAHHLAGDHALKCGELDRAHRCYAQARRLAPRRPGLKLGLAMVARARGDDEACTRYLLRETAIPGQDGRQTLQLARLLVEQGEYDHALAILTPVVDGPDDLFCGHDAGLAVALRIAGGAEYARGDVAAAVAHWRASLRLDRLDPEAWRRLAVAYGDLNRPRRAWLCVRRALRLQPDDAHLRRLAAHLRWQRLTRAAARPLRLAA